MVYSLVQTTRRMVAVPYSCRMVVMSSTVYGAHTAHRTARWISLNQL